MNASLTIGRFAGIKVQIHWTFWLLILFVMAILLSRGGTVEQMGWSILFILLLFVCVIFHEFGHALTAKRFDIGTRSITLLPIGGVASLNEIPEDPKAEFMIAAAGPAVNLIIALLLWLILPEGGLIIPDAESAETLQTDFIPITRQTILFYLFIANGALAMFNLLPAFPLDGGRVLRALLSVRFGRVRATRMASGLGKFLALFLFTIGLFYNIFLILIAVFIYFGADSENMMVMQLDLIGKYSIRDAMITRFTVLKPEDTLNDAVEHVLRGTERDFIVADESGIRGVLYMPDLLQGLKNQGGETSVSRVMDSASVTFEPDEPLNHVFRQLRRNQKNLFPVMTDGQLEGVIDVTNIDEFIKLRASLE